MQQEQPSLRLIGAHLYPFAVAWVVYLGEREAAAAILRNPESWYWYVLGYGFMILVALYIWPVLTAPGMGYLVYSASGDAGGLVGGILAFIVLEWVYLSYVREPEFFRVRYNPAVLAAVLAIGAAATAAGMYVSRLVGNPQWVYTGLRIGVAAGAVTMSVSPHVGHPRVPVRPLAAPGTPPAVQPAPCAQSGNVRAFDSLVGVEAAVEAIKDALELPLRHSQDMALYGLKPGKGILLWGPPGTGKTSVARATAEYFGCPFYVVNASELLRPAVGAAEQSLKEVFRAARANRPSVIFFDEIDAIGRKRDGQHLNRPSDLLLNLLLTEMDGFAPNDGVFVIAATNRLDVLDEALLRPGRFDRLIQIPIPDASAREKLFRLYLSGKPLGDIDYAELARRSERMSPAEIAGMCSGAALKALKRKISGGPGEIMMDDLLPGVPTKEV